MQSPHVPGLHGKRLAHMTWQGPTDHGEAVARMVTKMGGLILCSIILSIYTFNLEMKNVFYIACNHINPAEVVG